MSDHSISLVPKTSIFPNRYQMTGTILEWLFERDIIEARRSDCILNRKGGYRGSVGLTSVVQNSEALNTLWSRQTFGLEIVKEKNVFDTGENGLKNISCPNCNWKYDIEAFDIISVWWETRKTGVVCTGCGKIYDINEYLFTPQWAFSNLGFKFWNFPTFTLKFIEEFQYMLGYEIVVVNQHV